MVNLGAGVGFDSTFRGTSITKIAASPSNGDVWWEKISGISVWWLQRKITTASFCQPVYQRGKHTHKSTIFTLKFVCSISLLNKHSILVFFRWWNWTNSSLMKCHFPRSLMPCSCSLMASHWDAFYTFECFKYYGCVVM